MQARRPFGEGVVDAGGLLLECRDVDILDEPGVEFASGDQLLTLTSTPVSARAISLTAPTSGYVIVNASGYFDLNDATRDGARCSITNGATAIDFSHLVIVSDDGINSSTSWVPFATTRVYSVGSGTTTYRLVCDEFDGNVLVGDTSLNAIFVPTRY